MRFPSPFLALSWSVASVSAYAINSPLQYHNSHKLQPRAPSFIINLRDRIIESIFRPASNHNGKKTVPDSSAPQTLLARYGDDVVLRFNISTEEEVKALSEATNTLFLDVWEFTTEWVDIRLSKDIIPSLLGLLPQSLQHAHRPLLYDLAQSIYDSFPLPPSSESSPLPDTHLRFSPSTRSTPDETNIFFKDYQPLAVIVHWMELLESLFPTHARLVRIGTSFEGRDILGLRVGVHPTNSEKPTEPRKTVLITGGSHAREWISVSSVNYVLYSLVTAYGKEKDLTRLMEHFDWVFIPTLNPDGYVYSWENDRLWRKNRQQTSFRFCKGLDLDRAFGFQWEGEPTKGNPCSESYAGELPFEGVESLRFANWMKNETLNNNTTFIGYLDLHSYSQEILYPYSYSCEDVPPSLENLEEVALGLSKAIHQINGEHYSVEAACEGSVGLSGQSKKSKEEKRNWPKMESGGGSALDWMHHDMDIRYAYQIKLRDTGGYGFLLPNTNILPTGKEIFNAVKYFGQYLLSNHGIEHVQDSPPSDADIKTQPMRGTQTFDSLDNQPAVRSDTEEPNDFDHGLEL